MVGNLIARAYIMKVCENIKKNEYVNLKPYKKPQYKLIGNNCWELNPLLFDVNAVDFDIFNSLEIYLEADFKFFNFILNTFNFVDIDDAGNDIWKNILKYLRQEYLHVSEYILLNEEIILDSPVDLDKLNKYLLANEIENAEQLKTPYFLNRLALYNILKLHRMHLDHIINNVFEIYQICKCACGDACILIHTKIKAWLNFEVITTNIMNFLKNFFVILSIIFLNCFSIACVFYFNLFGINENIYANYFFNYVLISYSIINIVYFMIFFFFCIFNFYIITNKYIK